MIELHESLVNPPMMVIHKHTHTQKFDREIVRQVLFSLINESAKPCHSNSAVWYSLVLCTASNAFYVICAMVYATPNASEVM